MARKRGMGRYIRGGVDEFLTLTTLAAKTLVGDDFDQVVTERTLVSSIVANWSLTNWTPAAGDGPILVGIAHGDYTDAEIEAVIEISDSWDEGNLIDREVSARKVRRIGVFEIPIDANATVVLNDGKPMKTKLNWILNAGQTLRLWAYNLGTSPLATTAPIVNASGHANLFPK